jgi:transposase
VDPSFKIGRVLSVEDWAEIRRLHRAEGMPIKAIARRLGVGRNTVRRALAADGPPSYSRPAKPSIVDAVEPQIRALLSEWPSMPTTVLAERVGWQRSMTVFKDRVRQLRPLFVARRIRRSAPSICRANSRSVICGSRRRTCRWGSGRWVGRRCW